ncbi:MAG TPA: endonuclease/exonuclease/phosphatase family protein [Kiloniellales bacterium]|nr:endonuclease/exonuclease/phosphatase family protein [Kiloniellales bacterium]
MPDHPRLTLLTWNVHSCIGTDRRFDPQRVVHFLKRVHADIVAIQELGWHHRGKVGFDQFEYLSRETGYHVHEALTKKHDRAHYGNAILTRLPLLKKSEHDLRLPYRIPRAALEATFEVEGRPLRVINMHLGLDPWERRDQVSRLVPMLDAVPGQPTILMGDTNEWRSEGTALEELQRRLPRLAAPPSFHTRLPRLRYDRIYLSREIVLEDFDAVRVHEARLASDHLPVIARIRLPWKAEAAKPAEAEPAKGEG